MIGGMVSSTLLTLIVIPAVYGIVKEFGLQRTEGLPAQKRPVPEAAGVRGER
jgi:Cu(I)/Ag(I) efflux system membrane protein CusA/SilA